MNAGTKFTPGPWKVEQRRSFHNWHFYPITAQMDPTSTINLRTEVATAGDEFDAHLIAAVTEMYEALEALVSCLAPEDNDHAATKARVALAKARGEV